MVEPWKTGSSLSALSNLPGGGLVILGLDEENGFAPVRLDNPQKLKQSLARRAGESFRTRLIHRGAAKQSRFGCYRMG